MGPWKAPALGMAVSRCLTCRRRGLYICLGRRVLGLLQQCLEGVGRLRGSADWAMPPGAPCQHQDVTVSPQTLRLNRTEMITRPVLLELR